MAQAEHHQDPPRPPDAAGHPVSGVPGQNAQDLAQLADDWRNLLDATQIATMFLDRKLCVVHFTPRVAELFDIGEADRGCPLAGLTHKLGYDQLLDDARDALDRLERIEHEIQTDGGQWFLTRLQPYRTADQQINGVVISFIDITERKQAEQDTADALKFAESIVETLHEPLLVLNPDLTIKTVNPAFYEHFQVDPSKTIGHKIYELGNGQWNIPALRELLEDVLPDSNVFNDFVVSHTFQDIGHRIMLLNARRLDHVQLILLGIRDITERRQAEEALRQARDELELRVEARTAELRRQAERLRHLTGELASAERRERKRLAALLHDDLQQLLVAVKMRLGQLQPETADPQTIDKIVDDARDVLDQAIEASRDLTRQLRPPVLYEAGLVPALKWLADEMKTRHHLDVQVHVHAQDPNLHPLNEDVRGLLFEVVRELLFNIVKHANVNQAALTIEHLDQNMQITVADQGEGFHAADEDRDAGVGLFSIRERLAALNGRFELKSKPGQGTEATLQIPLDSAGDTTRPDH